ncbi:hypothetical protein DICVIV_11916 [Dictyocaulus viviparus]|uniref:Uncharacterized protein n=1 Tax=Dictyocaulus viviparus TaxID=29172 RepID=A0A0D8XBX7_DICVI|nr:hypothetical protein DICVIV_11916 [Dictyocaulus viviparus]
MLHQTGIKAILKEKAILINILTFKLAGLSLNKQSSSTNSTATKTIDSTKIEIKAFVGHSRTKENVKDHLLTLCDNERFKWIIGQQQIGVKPRRFSAKHVYRALSSGDQLNELRERESEENFTGGLEAVSTEWYTEWKMQMSSKTYIKAVSKFFKRRFRSIQRTMSNNGSLATVIEHLPLCYNTDTKSLDRAPSHNSGYPTYISMFAAPGYKRCVAELLHANSHQHCLTKRHLYKLNSGFLSKYSSAMFVMGLY